MEIRPCYQRPAQDTGTHVSLSWCPRSCPPRGNICPLLVGETQRLILSWFVPPASVTGHCGECQQGAGAQHSLLFGGSLAISSRRRCRRVAVKGEGTSAFAGNHRVSRMNRDKGLLCRSLLACGTVGLPLNAPRKTVSPANVRGGHLKVSSHERSRRSRGKANHLVPIRQHPRGSQPDPEQGWDPGGEGRPTPHGCHRV